LLLIEDETEMRERLAVALRFEGFIVHKAVRAAGARDDAGRPDPGRAGDDPDDGPPRLIFPYTNRPKSVFIRMT
jgi:hypothetical protein